MSNSFGPIAPHYDLLMANVPYDMWVGYYRLLLSSLELDPDTLLDVCCGTGTVAEFLMDAGYEVTGFDISAGMIEAARGKAAAKKLPISYTVDDATTFDLGKTFEGAYSFFDSLNYITDPVDLRKALHRVSAHLEPGGSFCFDLNTAYAFEAQLFDQEELRSKAPIRYLWKGEYDPGTRLIEVQMSFWRGQEELKEVHHQRAHPIEEVKEGLMDAGFDEIHVYDSYTLDPPRKKSDRVHFMAVKR